MINQWISVGMHRLLTRACVVGLAVVGLLLYGVPASHADGDGLLEDVTQVVGATAEQVVEPAAPVTQPVQQPVQQVVESVVQPVVAPAEQTVEAVVRTVEETAQPVVKAAEPVVKTVEPAVHRAGETGAKAVEPVVESAPAPVAPHAPVAAAPNGSSTGGVSAQGGAQPDAGAKGSRHEQRHADTAVRTLRTDLAPRAVGGVVIARNPGSGSGSGPDQAEDEALWALTNELMHLWAADPAPNAVNSGLPGGGMGALTLWRAPLLLGLLLGFLSLVLSRRRLG